MTIDAKNHAILNVSSDIYAKKFFFIKKQECYGPLYKRHQTCIIPVGFGESNVQFLFCAQWIAVFDASSNKE